VDEPDLRVDIPSGRVWHGGAEVELTAKEFKILTLLRQNANQVVPRERLLTEVWQLRFGLTTRTIDTHVANLRRKIERDPANPERIVTVHGRGYKYVTKKL
jgi:two-component system response regulator VicR